MKKLPLVSIHVAGGMDAVKKLLGIRGLTLNGAIDMDRQFEVTEAEEDYIFDDSGTIAPPALGVSVSETVKTKDQMK
jgi:hypothetical protein